ncbi:hypothetical protein VTO73DRAFT_1053 [Trametes versicolor]
MTSIDVVSDVADAVFDVVAPVADVPPSVDSTSLNHAGSVGEYSANDSANGADQVLLGTEELVAAPSVVQDSVTVQIIEVECVQVPSIGSVVVDTVSNTYEDESESSEDDEFIPRGGESGPTAAKSKPRHDPKTTKILASTPTPGATKAQESAKPGQAPKASQATLGSKPGQAPKASQATLGSKPSAPAASAPAKKKS